MKTNPFKVSLLATAVGLASGAAMAADMRIDGFASIYYGQALDKDELGAADELGTAAGQYQRYNDKADFQQDSKYGIQFRSNLGDGLSATGQIVGRGRTNFEANVTWAYLSYEFTDDLVLKAGRQRVPFFLYSDFLDVGYAYTWISPPAASYNLAGFDNIDGVNFEYTKHFGDWTSRLNLVFGASDTEVDSADGSTKIPVTTEDFWDVTWNLNYDWLTFQINYSGSSPTINALNELADGVNALTSAGGSPLTADQYNALTVTDDQAEYGGVGIAADWGTVLLVAEYTSIKLNDSPTSYDRSTWYVMAGYRWSKFTFALTYSEYDDPNNPASTAILDPLMSALAPIVEQSPPGSDLALLFNGINEAYYIGEKTEAYNLTIRYDFHPSAALKFDYTESDRELYRFSNPIELKPSIVRLGVDLVF